MDRPRPTDLSLVRQNLNCLGAVSLSSQRVLIWWALAFLTIYGLSLLFLLHMLPPPSATWSAERVARFYTDHATEIKIGATTASWTSGFMVPLAVAIGVQMYRHEKGQPVWTILAVAGGCLMSIFVVLPPCSGESPPSRRRERRRSPPQCMNWA